MSLLCGNCFLPISPSEELPGREGLLVTPLVPAVYWTVEADGSIGNSRGYAKGPGWIALCLSCVEGATRPEQQGLLHRFYDVYDRERDLGRDAWNLHDIHPLDWIRVIRLGYSEQTPLRRATEGFVEAHREFGQESSGQCMVCGEKIGKSSETNRPFFSAKGINRVFCEETISGIFGERNYSLCSMKKGQTGFNICFPCFAGFRQAFLAYTNGLGYCKVPLDVPKGEFIIGASVLDKMMEGKSPEELKKVSRILDEIGEASDLRIDFDH